MTEPCSCPPPPISQGHRFLPISVFPIPTRRDFVVFSRVDKIPCGTGIMPVRFTERMVSSIFPKSFSSTPTHSSSQARRKRKLKSMQSGVHIFSWICTSHFAGVMSTSRARKEDCTNHTRSHSPTACVPGGKEQILSLFSNDSTEPQIRSVTSPGSRRKKELMPSEDPSLVRAFFYRSDLPSAFTLDLWLGSMAMNSKYISFQSLVRPFLRQFADTPTLSCWCRNRNTTERGKAL